MRAYTEHQGSLLPRYVIAINTLIAVLFIPIYFRWKREKQGKETRSYDIVAGFVSFYRAILLTRVVKISKRPSFFSTPSTQNVDSQ